MTYKLIFKFKLYHISKHLNCVIHSKTKLLISIGGKKKIEKDNTTNH